MHQRMTVSNHCDVAQRTVGYYGWDVTRKGSIRIQSANQNETMQDLATHIQEKWSQNNAITEKFDTVTKIR